MSLYFRVHYRTVWGEEVAVQLLSGHGDATNILPLSTHDGHLWEGELIPGASAALSYRYVVLRNGEVTLTEVGGYRQIALQESARTLVADSWRPRAAIRNAFLSSAFTRSIFARTPGKQATATTAKTTKDTDVLEMRIRKPDVAPTDCVGITGNLPSLGSWKKAVPMDETAYPLWQFSMNLPAEQILIEYKFVLCRPDTGEILAWETGDNRTFLTTAGKKGKERIVITEEEFRSADAPWRGAGVAIPVFSLRSIEGMGIGEFADLKPLAQWSSATGMSVIQVLPVNDTIATHTWVDSYPYAAISVFALHPLYLRIDEIAPFKKAADTEAFLSRKKELNALEDVDFEKVLTAKMHFLRRLYTEQRTAFEKDKKAQAFISQNTHWLPAYAVFCHLRDKFGTCNFQLWPSYANFSENILIQLTDPSYEHADDVHFWYFVQYHADRQLTDALHFARQHSVVLKGDLPIGIYRYSCDAWVAPALYNMKEQAGAPPDDYAVDGQNWGFPTYNWKIMAADGFDWWKKRMQQLNRYFDALRIDHILGFFRIWQIPTNQIAGTLGLFNPRLPLSVDEIRSFGIQGDINRYTETRCTADQLASLFGPDADEISNVFFRREGSGDFVFRSSFPDQLTLQQFCQQNPAFQPHLQALLKLKTDVLLLEEQDGDGRFFNPRITLHTTSAYHRLWPEERAAFDRMYNEYFYQRHNTYWQQQALWKLPAILDASDMLICGEDLGMIPATVPTVMHEMNIMSLEIQRMPKGHDRFGQVQHYPYFSVCSPSCHDMSTIRGWWESDYGTASAFYHDYLHWQGSAPAECAPEVVSAIVEDHLDSPSMLAIFPIQDLAGMSPHLRKSNAASEQINDPSIPKHYWKFRFHLAVEDLLQEEEFNHHLLALVRKHGR